MPGRTPTLLPTRTAKPPTASTHKIYSLKSIHILHPYPFTTHPHYPSSVTGLLVFSHPTLVAIDCNNILSHIASLIPPDCPRVIMGTSRIRLCSFTIFLLLFPLPKSSKIPPRRSQFRIRHETRDHTHAPSLEVVIGYRLTTGSRV